MNLLVVFLVWLLIILIFLVLYMSYFRKIKQISKTNSVVERFNSNDTIPKHCDDVANKTGSNGSNIFYTEEGPYIDKCHINMSSNNYKEYSGKNLYKLNGKNSYIFIRDYLDNNFSITLWVKFDKLSGVQTLIETKFYKVEMKIRTIVIAFTGVSWASEHLVAPWVEKFDPATGKSYYLNTETNERKEAHKNQ